MRQRGGGGGVEGKGRHREEEGEINCFTLSVGLIVLQTWVFFSLVLILGISLNDQMGPASDKEERLGDVVRRGTAVVSETSAGGRGEDRGRDKDSERDVYMYSCIYFTCICMMVVVKIKIAASSTYSIDYKNNNRL